MITRHRLCPCRAQLWIPRPPGHSRRVRPRQLGLGGREGSHLRPRPPCVLLGHIEAPPLTCQGHEKTSELLGLLQRAGEVQDIRLPGRAQAARVAGLMSRGSGVGSEHSRDRASGSRY